MAAKVMMISTSETFIIKGVMNKIAANGYEVSHVAAQKNDLSTLYPSNADVFVYYLDDFAKEIEGKYAHIALKEVCLKESKKIIVVGDKEQYRALLKNFPQSFVYSFFERPLDMGLLLAKIKSLLEEKDIELVKQKVLVVDDDANYRQVVRDWLKDSYDVVMANGGVQAIGILDRMSIDLILLDYEMPITSGPQVMEMIRTQEEMANIPIVFLTGKSDRASIEQVLKLRPSGYLLKTVQKEALLEKVRELI